MKDAKWVCLVIVAMLLLALFFVYGFQINNGASEESMDYAKEACLMLCKTVTFSKSDGPCLSDEIAPDWACDVAHNPRIEVDEWAENQCNSYRTGSVHHFVEVTPDCKFIRAV